MSKFVPALFLSSALVAATFSVSAQATKIGAIRTADVVLQSPQFKSGAERMKAEFERRRNELEAGARKFQEDVEKFQREADLLSAADRAKREKELNTRRIDLGYQQRQLQEDMANRDRELTEELRARINEVIVQVARERGFDLIVQDPAFATEAVDITADVLKRLQAAN